PPTCIQTSQDMNSQEKLEMMNLTANQNGLFLTGMTKSTVTLLPSDIIVNVLEKPSKKIVSTILISPQPNILQQTGEILQSRHINQNSRRRNQKRSKDLTYVRNCNLGSMPVVVIRRPTMTVSARTFRHYPRNFVRFNGKLKQPRPRV